MDPKFGKIVDLIMLKDPQFVCLCVEIHAAQYFCSHYNAFVIESRVEQLLHPIILFQITIIILRAHRSFDTSDEIYTFLCSICINIVGFELHNSRASLVNSMHEACAVFIRGLRAWP